MYGGIITENSADYGGGVAGWTDDSFVMSGGVVAYNCANEGSGVYLNQGCEFTLNGGYLGGEVYKYDDTDTVNIVGGYLDDDAYKTGVGYLSATSIIIEIPYNISSVYCYVDTNYSMDFAYAVYTMSSYTIEDVNATYGSDYSLSVTGAYTDIIFSWGDYAATTELPTDIGEYTVTATLLNLSGGVVSSAGITTFKITISAAEATSGSTTDGEATNVAYNGNGTTSSLTEGTGYELSYSDNTGAGTSVENTLVIAVVIGLFLIIGFVVILLIKQKRSKKY